MPAKRKLDLPKGLSPAAAKAREEFMLIFSKYLEEARREIALTILVWGPSPNAQTPAARKREDIRDELVENGHYAVFSEDVPSIDDELSEKTKEHAQARAADLIIILVENSPGATAELHDFCGDPDIYTKIQVMIPHRYRKGYSAQGAIKDLQEATGGGGVYWYREGDLEECNVLTLAVRRAEAIRNLRFRSRGSRR